MKNAVKFAIKAARNDLSKRFSTKTNLLLTKPMQVSICPTQRCNVECLMCECWREKNDYINKDDVLNFLEDLRDWTGGNFFVQIAGGEPLVFSGIFEVFRFCSENKIICKISSNGYGLNESVCNKIIESGLPYLSVSLDSHIPEVHDKYRGRPGTFDKAVQGLKYLRANSEMTLGVSCIVMKENVGHLKEMTDYLLGMDIDRILFQPIRDYNSPLEKWQEYPFWVDDFDALDEAMDYLIEMKGKDRRLLNTVEDFELIRRYFKDPRSIINNRNCFIGYETLFVDDKGETKGTLLSANPMARSGIFATVTSKTSGMPKRLERRGIRW